MVLVDKLTVFTVILCMVCNIFQLQMCLLESVHLCGMVCSFVLCVVIQRDRLWFVLCFMQADIKYECWLLVCEDIRLSKDSVRQLCVSFLNFRLFVAVHSAGVFCWKRALYMIVIFIGFFHFTVSFLKFGSWLQFVWRFSLEFCPDQKCGVAVGEWVLMCPVCVPL